MRKYKIKGLSKRKKEKINIIINSEYYNDIVNNEL